MKTFLLVIFFCVKQCVSVCPTDTAEKYKLCISDKSRMDKECPNFYCGTGQKCDKSKADPHADCRLHKSAHTSGYCHLVGVSGYMCSEITDGKVPSRYSAGRCISASGATGGVCGLDICPVGKFGSKTWAKKPKEHTWFPTVCKVCEDGSFSSTSASHACECPAYGKEAFAPDPKNPNIFTQERDCKPGWFNDRSYIDPKLDHNDPSLWRPKGFGYAGTPCGKCEKCPENSFSSSAKGNSHCQCPTRGHQANKEQTDTEQCPKGKFQEAYVSWKRGGTPCPKCSWCSEFLPGSFADTEGQEKCDCPKAGYEANEDGTAERPCMKGHHKNTTACLPCERCPGGTYQNARGSHGCQDPSIGHYAVNSTAEQSCFPGSFKAGPGPATACEKCANGQYTPNPGSNACIKAAAGHEPVSISERAKRLGYFDGIATCKPGYHQDKIGQAACKQCPRGKFSKGESQSICDCASSGHISNAARNGEQACPLGTYTADNELRMAGDCRANDSSTGNWDCTECQVGRYGEHRHADNCSYCPEGKYQHQGGKDHCKKCAKNHYMDEMGGAYCKKCPIWDYQEKEGATDCQFCLTMESAFGFSQPQQCWVIWIILGVVVGTVTLSLSLKFCSACTQCCAMCCRGKQAIIVKHEGYGGPNQQVPMAAEVPKKKKKKYAPKKLTSTLSLTGDSSDEEEFVSIRKKKNDSSSDDDEMVASNW